MKIQRTKIDTLPIPLPPGSFAVRISEPGLSARGRKLEPGDLCVIDPFRKPQAGDMVIDQQHLVPYAGQQAAFGVAVLLLGSVR